MLQPLLSVIMPTRNQAGFIEASIRSVLDQDYPHLELVVVDGASTDGTQELLSRLASEDSRLRWISEPDSGPASALNKALKLVRGTFVGWLNSDDLYVPGALRRAVVALEENPHWLMVYGHGQHIDESGAVIEAYPTLPPDGPVSRFNAGCFICQPTAVFRRTLVLLNGFFDDHLKCSFDMDYWLRAFKALPDRIGFVDATQAQSRLHEGCITSTARRQVAYEGMQVLHRHLGSAPREWVLTYLEEVVSGKATLPPGSNPPASVLELVEQVRPFLPRDEWDALRRVVQQDSRLENMSPLAPSDKARLALE